MARRREEKRRLQEMEAERKKELEDAEVKEDLCSNLMTIKNASVSPEGRKYSEGYVSGLKKLTAPEAAASSSKAARNPYPETTDDSKSWYRSKHGAAPAQLPPDTATSAHKPRPGHDTELKITGKSSDPSQDSDLPGFLAKTPYVKEENKLENDIHFESEFPTFSAYLKRTYGQTYQYRTRESSETSEKEAAAGGRGGREADGASSDHPDKRTMREAGDRDRRNINDPLCEYSISDKVASAGRINDQQQRCSSDVEHISRKANYIHSHNKDVALDKPSKISNYENLEQDNSDPKSFLSRSKESIYESSGAAPANSECYNKQLIKVEFLNFYHDTFVQPLQWLYVGVVLMFYAHTDFN